MRFSPPRGLRLLVTAVAIPFSLAHFAMADATQRPEWTSLFNGKTTQGWHPYKKPGTPVTGWEVVDGAITRVGKGGDIVTDAEFGDFELELAWKLKPVGNSGIFYRATETTDDIYENATEMQVLDNIRHPDNKTPLTLAGANYALYPAPADAVKPVGEWNAVRIVAKGAHVEHWLNGRKVVDYEMWSPDWEGRVKKSKFAEFPTYGRAKKGHVGLQDHGDWVAYKSIRVRELK
ncbi:MAG: DUF1080 domain-containing protein [Gemmatimonadaceae bacterium]